MHQTTLRIESEFSIDGAVVVNLGHQASYS